MLKGVFLPFVRNKFFNSLYAKCVFVFVLGAISSLIFPPFKNVVYGYVALLSFLTFLFYKDRTKKDLFYSAYLFGAAFYIVSFAWINNALLVAGEGVSDFIPLVVIAIGGFFGLFWAIPAYFINCGNNLWAKAGIFASGFVLMEWVRSFIFTGFPWNLLSSSLAFNTYLLQGLAFVGGYGVSFFLMLFLVGVVITLIDVGRKKINYGGIVYILVALLFFAYTGSFFDKGYDLANNDNKKLLVRLVQPSIPQTMKWDEKEVYKNFRTYIDMSQKGDVSFNDVDLVVWGETASPYFLDREYDKLEEIKEAVPENGFLATGTLRVGMDETGFGVYNSLFVINKEGIKDYYDKSHLVPFGEYLPFRKYLPEFMKPVTNIIGEMKKGEQYKNISVNNLPLMGGAICYESIFPKGSVNQLIKPEILLVIANDGWYGDSAGPYQHFVAAQMRAVEEGITVICSGNNGISAVINSRGEVSEKLELNEVGTKDVYLKYPLVRKTLYGSSGDIIPLQILFMFLLLIFLLDRKK